MASNSMLETFGQLSEDIRVISEHLAHGVEAGQLSLQEIRTLINSLPRLQEHHVIDTGEKDNVCPICFVPYLAILSEEEMASAMDSPAHPVESMGVTKLSQAWQCGHMFCRRDISKWISDGHASCPMCRSSLLERRTGTSHAEEPVNQSDIEERLARVNSYLPEILRSEDGPLNALANMLQMMRSSGSPSLPAEFLGQFSAAPFARHQAPPTEDDRQEYSGMYS